ncbi:MAG: heavy metal-responsive transcriptional regulator [Actinomycetota bacterium]|nr:heavy metal-responsive transcriptional regulator [Actinomycetota bacterium]
MTNHMMISEFAARAGTTADTVRYYERIGLLPEPRRSDSGYRLFGEHDVERLHFVKRAQSFGLHLDEIAALVRARDRGLCPCGHARELLTDRLAEIEEQLESLSRLRDEIHTMLDEGAVAGDGCWPCGSSLLQIQKLPREVNP